jgi:WD40 repeat protein
VFTDLDYEVFTNTAKCEAVSEHLNRVFVGSRSGMLFVVNYHTREIESVFQLHSEGINSVVASAGFCVTGGDDFYLRVWPTDFSEFYIEAKHEAPVVAVDISPDALYATCGTSNGCLGLVNIPTYSYQTIHRSHYG